ncbi:MAG TPA: hypothetical protein VD793_02955, partial [Gemmatimonadales bacterium]|nr:hypothetical protein [Gemmatimonadales bacterium]
DVPPRVHRRVLAELAAVLEGVTPGGVPSLVRSLAAERWPRRVVVVSDFLSEADGLLARARHLVVQGVEVVGIHVVSQQELEPSDRSVTAVDPEAPVVRRPYAPAARASYQGAFGAWREAVAGDWRTAGAAFHQVLAEEATAAAVRRVIRPAP